MATPNRKITDLPLTEPIGDHRFVVATQANNYQIPYSGVIGPITGQIGDLSGQLVATGQILENKIDIVSGIAMDNRDEFRSGFAALQQTHYFIHDVKNDQGPIIPIYYDHTPTPNTVLSGIYVNTANSLQVSSRWDGTFSDYIGTGYIQESVIPLSNITEFGEMSRRFEGTIDGINGSSSEAFYPRTGIISGRNEVAWNAENGRDPYILKSSGYIDVIEMGPGPTATNIFIDDIALATPRPGENLGESALKHGDIINIFVDYDFNLYHDVLQEPSGIEVFDEGLAEHIDFTSYPLIEMGAGIKRATIPVTVSDRVGDLGVSIRSISNLGTTGTTQSTADNFPGVNSTRLLDQLYPDIIFQPITDYNGRSDGLREGESIDVVHSILNWDSNDGDTVEYLNLQVNATDILVLGLDIYQDPKTVSYSAGIFNESPNLRLSSARRFNGATDSKETTIKIANGPSITDCEITLPAVQSVSPHLVGTADLKAGDTVHVSTTIDTQGVSIDSIQISVEDSGISDGSQTAFTNSYTSDPTLVTDNGNDIYVVNVPVTVSSTRTGVQSVTMVAKNTHNTLSDTTTSSNTANLDQIGPSFTLNNISYILPNLALGPGDSCAVNVSTSNFDNILYTSIDGDLDIPDPGVDFDLKVINCINPSTYNISVPNVKVLLTKTTNGLVLEDSFVVNIASKPIEFSINLPSALVSSLNGENYTFSLESDQEMYENPSLELSPDQSPQSILIQKSQGTSLTDNNFEILVKDSDLKGVFDFTASGKNLAGVETFTSTPTSYQISGFTERTISVHPHSLLQGLGDIGTTVTNPLNVSMENLSEAGAGPNGGTDYYYRDPSQTVGPEISIRMDIDDGFTICSGDGLISSTGSFFFNLDFLSRAANADTSTPAKYLISEL
jgi:hypothetical protein